MSTRRELEMRQALKEVEGLKQQVKQLDKQLNLFLEQKRAEKTKETQRVFSTIFRGVF